VFVEVATLVDVARVVVFAAATALWIILAFAVARKAARLGRDETVWMLYGFGIPVISFIHAVILERRSRNENPLR
jgi:hypothetical protein